MPRLSKKAQDEILQGQESTKADEGCAKVKLPLYGLATVGWLPDQYRVAAGVPEYIRQPTLDCIAGRKPWPLFYSGEAGSRKTCSALLVLDWCGGLYREAKRLFDEVGRARRRELQWSTGYNKTEDEYWQHWGSVNMAVLDEVGWHSQGAPQDVKNHEYACIRGAIDTRHGKPLIIISNYGLEQLERFYGDSVPSRLTDGTIVYTKGDMRGATP